MAMIRALLPYNCQASKNIPTNLFASAQSDFLPTLKASLWAFSYECCQRCCRRVCGGCVVITAITESHTFGTYMQYAINQLGVPVSPRRWWCRHWATTMDCSEWAHHYFLSPSTFWRHWHWLLWRDGIASMHLQTFPYVVSHISYLLSRPIDAAINLRYNLIMWK